MRHPKTDSPSYLPGEPRKSTALLLCCCTDEHCVATVLVENWPRHRSRDIDGTTLLKFTAHRNEDRPPVTFTLDSETRRELIEALGVRVKWAERGERR